MLTTCAARIPSTWLGTQAASSKHMVGDTQLPRRSTWLGTHSLPSWAQALGFCGRTRRRAPWSQSEAQGPWPKAVPPLYTGVVLCSQACCCPCVWLCWRSGPSLRLCRRAPVPALRSVCVAVQACACASVWHIAKVGAHVLVWCYLCIGLG